MGDFVDSNQYFETIRKYKHIILFGCGGKGRQAIPILEEQGIQIFAACDNNAGLWGKEFLPGITIQSPDQAIQSQENCCIIVTAAIVNALEICRQIRSKYPQIPIFHLCSPFKVEQGLLSRNDFEAHLDDIKFDFAHLQDEESQRIYCDTINWKLTGNMLISADRYHLYTAPPIYSFFDDQFIKTDENSVYVDIGAYTGDSIESFLIFTRGMFKKIIAVEADGGNFSALNQFVAYSCVENIETHNLALWSTCEDKIFYTNSANKDIRFGSPNLFQSVDEIADNKALEQMKDKLVGEHRYTNTLDHLLENEAPSIIKINAMAADRHIVLGGTRTLRRYKPTLIFEFGVSKKDVYEMMKTIRSINHHYTFYLRRKKIFGDIKTVLYCK